MQLLKLTEKDKDQYNQFVAAQESGSFLQSWDWGEWQVRLGRTVHRFKIVDDSGTQIASIQLIKMPLPFGKYYLYAPYGPVTKQDYELRIADYELELKQKFEEAVFIRIEPKEQFAIRNSQSLIKTSNIQPAKTLVIDLSKTEEQLLGEMHNKTRYNIKVAQKHGVEIKEELEISIGHGLYFKEALDLICTTSNRQAFNSYPFSYYQNLMDMFALSHEGALKAHLYKAAYGNNLLVAGLMIDFGKTRTYLFGGSSDNNKNVMAPYLMHWQAMLDAKKQGMEYYDFWGIETSSGATPGFVRFKLGFAPPSATSSGPSGQSDSGPSGGIKEYAGAYDIINNNKWYKVYKGLRWVNKKVKRSK